MTNKSARHYEYTLAATISVLDGWANKGRQMYGIDTAVSAVYWLEHAPAVACRDDGEYEVSFSDTVDLLRGWLADDTPNLPDRTGEAALYWLRRVREQGKTAVPQ